MATDTTGDLPSLPVLSSKRFPQPLNFPFTAYCHAFDLLAVVTAAWDVSVFRITIGQIAFTVRRKDLTSEITALSWKTDGTCLGIGWSDDQYGIYDGGNGKQLHLVETQLSSTHSEVGDWKLDLWPVTDEEEDEKTGKKKVVKAKSAGPSVRVLGWMGHEAKPVHSSLRDTKLTTDEWYDGAEEAPPTGRAAGVTLTDLPRTITTLDVSKVLPRLSAIAPHGINPALGGPNHSTYISQAGTDGVFLPQREVDSNSVPSLLVCQDNGITQVLLDETVKVGTLCIEGEALAHTANAQSSSHVVLTQIADGSLHLKIIDLPLQSLRGPLLLVITTNTKRIQTLLDYIMQTLRCMAHDYETNVLTASKFLASLAEMLRGSEDEGVVTNFFHLAMTGVFSPHLLEWLTDIVRETNIKRWEQSLNTMYSNIRNHIFINLLPALDRLSMAVTTLRGFATLHEGSSKFDCPPHLFSNILDKIDSLRLVAQKMQLITQIEHRQFRAFIKWFKTQLEIAQAEPFSNSALEAEEREVPGLDYSLILAYIQNTMMASKLDVHLKDRPGMGGETIREQFFSNPIISSISYERAKQVMKTLDASKASDGPSRDDIPDPLALINIPAIASALVAHVRIALEQITQWQSRMLSPAETLPLHLPPTVRVTDMIMTTSTLPSSSHAHTVVKLLVLDSSQPNEISILEHTISPPTTGPLPSPRLSTSARGGDDDDTTASLLDAKWTPHNPTVFLTLTQSLDTGAVSIVQTTHAPPREHENQRDVPETSFVSQTLHVFPAGITFRPSGMRIGGRRDKAVCVVFGSEGREWRVFDLDDGKKALAVSR